MKSFCRRLAGLLTLSLAALPVSALAEPQNGFGLAIGPTAHHARVVAFGAHQTYNSAGFGITADAQFVVNDNWSINPVLQAALEKAHGDITNNLGNSQAGLEFRRWFGNGFVAPVLIYSLEDVLKNGVQRAEYGPGVGLVTGWESPAGLTVSLQVDAPESLYFSSNQRRAGAWLQFGYRWH